MLSRLWDVYSLCVTPVNWIHNVIGLPITTGGLA